MKSDRKFEIKLYPDATNYDCSQVLLKAMKYWDYWAYITHDKDKDEDGLILKPHIHFIGRNKEDVITPKGFAIILKYQNPHSNKYITGNQRCNTSFTKTLRTNISTVSKKLQLISIYPHTLKMLKTKQKKHND